jgi:putative addiction module CopG family antidote
MVMNVTLTPQAEEVIKRFVESGRYGDASAVVEEALLALEEYERSAALRAVIAVGEADFERGDFALYTPDLVAQMERNADRKLAVGHEPNPDVCP